MTAFGQGLPPAGGWKLAMQEDPTEYSPEFQDEYRRLWHEAAAERDRYRAALERFIAWDGSELRDPTYLSENLIPSARAALEALDAAS